MFFKLRVSGAKASNLSYIISKHPDTLFQREVGKRGRMFAKFGTFEDTHVAYNGYIENFSLPFYKICRHENLSSYVTSEQYSVCPYNLVLLNTVFRSVLRGKFGDISQEDFDRIYNISFQLGPFSLYKKDYLVQAFTDLNYTVCSGEASPFVLDIRGDNNLTTFLQQMYVISYAYTNHLRQIIPQKQDIGKYLEFSKGWIDDHPAKNYLINRISKVRRNVKQFQVGLLENKGVEDAEKQFDERINSLKVKASELRYQTIKFLLLNSPFADNILDFGCGNGNLINRVFKDMKPKKYIGFDSHRGCVNTAYKRGKQQLRYRKNKETEFKVWAGSILYPDYSLFEGMDTVVLSEVIEHFYKEDLDTVLDVIFKGINPATVILTTPNKDFNVNFNFAEDQLRHPDHKFEFTKEEIISFTEMIEKKYGYISNFWHSDYSTSENGIEDENRIVYVLSKKPYDSLSFIVKFERTVESVKDTDLIEQNKFLYSPFDLNESAYRISSKIIREGSATFNHKIDPRWIVSLAPNMSPADSSEDERYIESPWDTIKYYCNRGVHDLILETKYMGSRGTIVATKERSISEKLFGSKDLIQIYSRKGYKFFDDLKLEEQIYEEVRSYMKFMEADVIALDTEILPWSYKGQIMIEKEFEKPGKCALMDKVYTGRGDVNELLYLNSLKNYTKDTPIQIYPFNIILKAQFDGRKFRKVDNGYYYPHDYQLEQLYSLTDSSDIFKRVQYLLFNPRNTDMTLVKEFWDRIILFGLEGVVVKPRYPTQFLTSGRYIQPALKCRTQDYLRIIYGIDYLNPENMKFLKKRRTANKRKLAMQQFELSQKILYSFINRNSNQRLKYIFSFFGMEKVSNIDATL